MTEHTDTPPVAGETTEAAVESAVQIGIGTIDWDAYPDPPTGGQPAAEAADEAIRAAIAAYLPHLTAERDAETTALRASELDANATLGRTVRLLATALGLDPQTVRLDDLIERAENLRARDAAWKAYADDLSALLDRRNWYAPPLPAVLADPAPSTPAAQENQA